ncbi:MAG: hypothetical protein KGN84_17395 [Acidobacteriota bacterium]|nr:hypothetical protein [Acidobacteriota bacterium]
MGGFASYFSVRRRWFRLLPLAALARLLPAQDLPPQNDLPIPGVQPDVRFPNGKLQRDEILKAEYEANLKDARNLMDLTKSFELDLEKSDRFVLSLGLLKQLDDIEKLTKRIRGRMRH